MSREKCPKPLPDSQIRSCVSENLFEKNEKLLVDKEEIQEFEGEVINSYPKCQYKTENDMEDFNEKKYDEIGRYKVRMYMYLMMFTIFLPITIVIGPAVYVAFYAYENINYFKIWTRVLLVILSSIIALAITPLLYCFYILYALFWISRYFYRKCYSEHIKH